MSEIDVTKVSAIEYLEKFIEILQYFSFDIEAVKIAEFVNI